MIFLDFETKLKIWWVSNLGRSNTRSQKYKSYSLGELRNLPSPTRCDFAIDTLRIL